jgi:23S rRNA (uracil1939-C5)-methyltransferase
LAPRKRHSSNRPRKKAPAKMADVSIESIGARGDGIANIDGVRIHVPYTSPGDMARIRYSGAHGRIVELVSESPHRVTPPCRYFGKCGGCAAQHLDAQYYRDWKRKLIIGALAREGFEGDIVRPVVACPAQSRRRAGFAVCKAGNGIAFGFNERASAQIVDIESCLVLDPGLQEVVPGLRTIAAAAAEHWRSFDLTATLCDNGVDASIAGDVDIDDLRGPEFARLSDAVKAAGIIRLSVGDAPLVAFETPVLSFDGVPAPVPPGAFLQPSREGEAALVKLVMDHVAGAGRIADLFSGCGTFTFPLADGAAVDAFDSDQSAIGALDHAARAAKLNHSVTAEIRNLFVRPLMAAELKAYEAIIFDPPRAGAKEQAGEIARSPVPVVIGVSCNPASFSRDAAILRAGGYALSQVTPVDQFVYSPHVELVGIFKKG